MARTFVTKGVLAIPAGHRVEILVFGQKTSLFGSALTPMIHDPLVRDLDTGVVYGRGWHFTADGGLPATEIPLEVRADLTVVERVLGRVTGARVLSGLLPEESGRHGWITTLLVDPE